MAAASKSLDCAVCLQECLHAVRLPCQHVFCYLCVKGAALMNKHCPLCRAEVPLVYFNSPDLLEKRLTVDCDEKYRWYYQGVNGWWLYDERTALELETAYQDGKASSQILVSGMTYVVDFSQMIQVRKNHPNRVRRVKRDLPSAVETKGIAGIRLPKKSDSDVISNKVPDKTDDSYSVKHNPGTASSPSSRNLTDSGCHPLSTETLPSIRHSHSSSSNRASSAAQTGEPSDELIDSFKDLSLNSRDVTRKD